MSEGPDLHLDVYVTPMRPMRGTPAQGPGDNPRVVWHCAREAVKKRQQA